MSEKRKTAEMTIQSGEGKLLSFENLAKKEKLSSNLAERKGSVKVAKYYPGQNCPMTPGYTNILIHTSAHSLGGQLSPYNLKTVNGALLENAWQFSKVYPKVHAQTIHLSKYVQKVIWFNLEETHCIDGNPTNEFWLWRERGFANEYAVRYPNGYKGRHEVLFSVWPTGKEERQFEILNYIEARKKIYCALYLEYGKRTKDFELLLEMLNEGKNLQLIEVDGPDPSLNYFPYNQISKEDPGLTITEDVIKSLLNDERKPFGHGYVIAAMLLGGDAWLQ